MQSAYRASLRELLFGILVGSIAVVARAAAQPLLGDALPFVFAFLATVLASLLWGVVPGIVAATVCAFGVWVPNIPPTVVASQQSVQFGWFAVSTLVTSVLCDVLRASRPRVAPVREGQQETSLSAWLRAVLWAALFIPLSAFVAASWWSLDRAEAASSANLAHATELALRHAERTFAVARQIAQRADQASRFTDDDARSHEAEIHLRLSDMAAGPTAVVNASIWDASGVGIARSDDQRIDPALSIADRDYFQRQRVSSTLGVSTVLRGRQTGKEVVNVTLPRLTADGRFDGIVSVTLAPSFFRDYYQSLANDEPTLASFALLRDDGSVLARWPGEPEGDDLASGSALMRAVTAGAPGGELTVTAEAGRGTQMLRFTRVGAFPVYVVAGISRTALLSNWTRVVGVLAAIVFPITAGLVYVTWVSLRKTRREAAIAAELQCQVQARADAERRMLAAQRLETLSFVTGSVAHDFNNLLMVITSSLHLHRKRRPDTADDKTLAAISRSVSTGARLTRQLLSFSRKQVLLPEVIRFQTWLPEADALLRSSLGSTSTWLASVEPDTRSVRIDPSELELALLNLVLNAKLAMPQGGRLTVHVANDADASPDAPMVVICVIDTGTGIDADVMVRVFEPFFTTRQRGVGSGLGLTQVEGFCLRAGGRVSIDSVVGQGTTICLYLPASANEAIEPDRTTTALPPGTLEARVLLVEDNDDVGRASEQMLHDAGCSVVRVVSADAALAHLAADGSLADIVLTDVAMPGSLDGIGLALEIRRLYPALPVILNTGYAERIEQGIAMGLRVFQKPVPGEVLLGEIRALLAATKTEPSPIPAR